MDTKSEAQLKREDTLKEFADKLERLVNGFRPAEDGETVGRFLQRSHRTLQGNIVKFMFGVMKGLAEQERTDARNEQAIEACRMITEQVENGDLPYQRFI